MIDRYLRARSNRIHADEKGLVAPQKVQRYMRGVYGDKRETQVPASERN